MRSWLVVRLAHMTERAFLKELLTTPEAPPNLEGRIRSRIERAALRQIWAEVSLATLGAVSILGYAYAASAALRQEIQESSFLEFTQLFVSDPDIFISNIQESAWSFFETIPMHSILLGLGLTVCGVCLFGFLRRLREVRQQFSLSAT